MADTTHTHRRRPRPGFTLVEILVVISIIAVLFSLSMAAYTRVRSVQMVRTAEDIVAKLQGGVDDQLTVIIDNIRSEKQNRSNEFVGLLNYCGGDADRAGSLLTYCRVRQNFPQTGAELAAGGGSFTVGGVNFRYSPAFAPLAGMTGTPQQQSAAILYIALSQRVQGGKTFDFDAATSGAQDEITTNRTARVFVDAWRKPVPFVRFHQAPELDQPPFSKAGSAFKDPFDPGGKLALSTWANKNAAEAALGYSTPNSLFNNRNKSIVVYSFGRDGQPSNLDADDVVGYRLRSIGAKGDKP